MLEKAPVSPERSRLLSNCYLRKGLIYPDSKSVVSIINENTKNPTTQALNSQLSIDPTLTIHKLYCIESDDKAIYIYCSYINQPMVTLWVSRGSKLKNWQSLIVDIPENASCAFNHIALSRNTKHLCITVGCLLYVYLLSKVAAINSYKLVGHTKETLHIAISRDSKICASCEKGPTVRVHDLRTGIPMALLTMTENLPDSGLFISSVEFCFGGDIILGAGIDGKIRIWDIVSAKELTYISCSHMKINDVAVSENRAYVLACEDLTYLSLWSLKTRTQFFLIKAHKEEIRSMAISHNEEFVLSSGIDGYVRLWDIPQGNCIANLSICSPIKCAAIIADDYILFAGENLWFLSYPLYRVESSEKLIIKVASEKFNPVEYEPQPNEETEQIKERQYVAIQNAARALSEINEKGFKDHYEKVERSIKELLRYEDYPTKDLLDIFGAHDEIATLNFQKEIGIAGSEYMYSYELEFPSEKSMITTIVLSKERDKFLYGTTCGSLYSLNELNSKCEALRVTTSSQKNGEITTICFVQSSKLAACSNRYIFFIMDLKTRKFLSIKNVFFFRIGA